LDAELKRNFTAILSNPESPTKLLTDTLRTLRYSYRQTDPDVVELVALAIAQGVAEPSTTNPGAAGLASYEYCTIADMQAGSNPNWRQLNPFLAENRS
jgi:hypothetical protein